MLRLSAILPALLLLISPRAHADDGEIRYFVFALADSGDRDHDTLTWLQKGASFSDIRQGDSLSDCGNCDVILRVVKQGSYTGQVADVEALSGRTRESLGRYSGKASWSKVGVAIAAPQIESDFGPGTALRQKIVALRTPAPAPAPAYAAPAAPAFSREDMQRIADDAAKKAAEETARNQPKAVDTETMARALEARSKANAKAIVSDVDTPRYHDAARPDDVALVVGVEKYNDLPDAQYAERDAIAVRDHLLALGFAPRNVILLTGARASKAGITTGVERKLPAMVKPTSTVFFYYSGHGAPDTANGRAYLLPADGDPQYLEDSAYPLPRLYAKLGALKAKRVLVALDSCFSGAGGRSVLPKGTRPLVTKIDEGLIPGKVASLTASRSSEISGTLDEQGHGVFTYFFLKGLANGRRSFG
jgi:hypothetical protein